MFGKRMKRNKVQRFYCPYCERRLWRLNSPKHFLFGLGASDIQPNSNCIDSNFWSEEFFCGEHGKLWMRVTRKSNGKLVITVDTSKDW